MLDTITEMVDIQPVCVDMEVESYTVDRSTFVSSRVGDVASLSVEVVVNPTNETLTDKNPVSSRLLEAAGPELKEECKSQIISECPPLSHTASQCYPALPPSL